MDSFEQELKQSFLEEAAQLMEEAETCFLELERAPGDVGVMERIFRIAHNLKGSSKAVGFDELGAFTHEFESYLLKFKNGERVAGPDSISTMLAALDWIRASLDGLRANGSCAPGAEALVESLKAEVKAEAPAAEGALPSPDALADEAESSVEATNADELAAVAESSLWDDEPAERMSIEDAPSAEDAFVAPQPVTPVPAPSAPRATGLPASGDGPSKSAAGGAADDSIRVSVARLEKLLNFVGELVILQTVLREQAVSGDTRLLLRTAHQMGKATKEVQDLAMSLRMVPLKPTFQKMHRIVRDASKMLGKSVELISFGEDSEVDKTVLEALSDPLVHLIRNAVDHGIEDAAGRAANGKPAQGSLALRGFHRDGKLVIEIEDDGGGIDGARLLAKAKEKGIVRADAKMTEAESINLIFAAGFSTKPQATELSGRGVGMDVVKTNIEKLKGRVDVETEIGKGTVFRISLPLTLAIVDGMIVRCGDERYVIPLSHVHESIKLEPNSLKRLTGLGEALMLRGETLPAVRLADSLGRKRAKNAPDERIALIFRTQGRPFAALVDDIVSQHQVVVKKLGAETRQLRQFSGSAILGDGRPALIVEVSNLSAMAAPLAPPRAGGAAA